MPESCQHKAPYPDLTLRLPEWVPGALPPANHQFGTMEERMDLAIRLATLNVEHGTGGPFGAAIFNLDTAMLVAPGVNLVLPAQCSVAHAEIMAIMLAQKVLGTHDLGGPGMSHIELACSAEPCAMCLGALPWSGVRSLVCGARDKDVRSIGFDEGPKARNWVSALKKRGIDVIQNVKRKQAVETLQAYVSAGGPVYNGRSEESGLRKQE